jgi:signal transduction histidine kinase
MSELKTDHNLSFLRHDIANVLMVVRGYAELMLTRESLDPALRRYPEQIILAVDRAARDLAQLSSGAQEKSPFPAPGESSARLEETGPMSSLEPLIYRTMAPRDH